MHLNGDISIQGLLVAFLGIAVSAGGLFWKASRYFKGAEDHRARADERQKAIEAATAQYQKDAQALIELRHSENRIELKTLAAFAANLETRVEAKFEKLGDTITQLRMEQSETKATVNSLAGLVKDCWGVNQQVRALLDTVIKPKRNS